MSDMIEKLARAGEATPAEEIGRLCRRILELAPAAGLYVGIKIEPAHTAMIDSLLTEKRS